MRRALLLLLLVACGGRNGAGPGFVARGALVEGTLPLLDGGEVVLEGLRGKPLVVHFFTTWSLPAQADLDELRAAREKAPPGSFKILGVALDKDGYRLIAPWRDAARVDWLVALPTDSLVQGKTVFGNVMAEVPSTVVVDAQGHVAWSHRGPLPPGALARQLSSLTQHR